MNVQQRRDGETLFEFHIRVMKLFHEKIMNAQEAFQSISRAILTDVYEEDGCLIWEIRGEKRSFEKGDIVFPPENLKQLSTVMSLLRA